MPKYQLKVRQDTLGNFDSSDVVLAKGEPAIITNQQDASGDTTAFFYIGDGTSQIVDGGGLKPALAAYENVAGGANNYAPIDATTLTGLTTAQDIEVKSAASATPELKVISTNSDSTDDTTIGHNSINCGGIISSAGGNITSGELDVTGATVDVNGTSEFKGNVVISNEADLSFETNCSITTTNGAITTGSGAIQSTSGNFTSTSGSMLVPGSIVQVKHYQTTHRGDQEISGEPNLANFSFVQTSDNKYVEVDITPKSLNSKLLVQCSWYGIDPTQAHISQLEQYFGSLASVDFGPLSTFTPHPPSFLWYEDYHVSTLSLARRNEAVGTLYTDVANPKTSDTGRNRGLAHIREEVTARTGTHWQSPGYTFGYSDNIGSWVVGRHFNYMDTTWSDAGTLGTVRYRLIVRPSKSIRLYTNQSYWTNAQTSDGDFTVFNANSYSHLRTNICVKEIAG